MHGWPMTWWEWHTVMPDLAKTHTVIAFDLPGLGNSAIPTNFGYTTADTAMLPARRGHGAGLRERLDPRA